MTGFEIKFNDEAIYASTDNVHIIIDYYKSFYLSVGGISKSKGEGLTWYSGNIDDIDMIKVKVVDVAQNSEIKECHSTAKEVYELMEYQNLRENLKREGII